MKTVIIILVVYKGISGGYTVLGEFPTVDACMRSAHEQQIPVWGCIRRP